MKFTKLTQRKKNLKGELLRIKKALIKSGAIKIILFGSYARGHVSRTTDIDLLVVKDTKKPFSERLSEVYDKIIPTVAADILVYTPDELDNMSEWNSFIKKILKEGKVIYAA